MPKPSDPPFPSPPPPCRLGLLEDKISFLTLITMKKIDSSPALVPANLALYLVRAYYYHNETCYQKLEAEGLYTMIKKFSKLCQND